MQTLAIDEAIDAAPPDPLREGALRAFAGLLLSAAVALVAAPVVSISTAITLLLPSATYRRMHLSLLRALWATEWRLLRLLVRPRHYCAFEALPVHANVTYGFVYFGVVNLLDVICAAPPLVAAAASANVIYLLATGPLDAGSVAFELALLLLGLAAAILSSRLVGYRFYVPFATAWAHMRGRPMVPQTPRTPSHEDIVASGHVYLDMAEPKLSDDHSVSSAYSATMHAWASAVADTCTLSTSHLPQYVVATSSSPATSATASPTSPVPKAATVYLHSMSTNDNPTSIMLAPPAHRLQPPMVCMPSAPTDDEMLLQARTSRHMVPMVTQLERRASQQSSSSEEEDFQALCDSILQRHGRRYDVLSPPPTPDVRHRSLPSSISSATSDQVFRGLDDPPQFTAYAPRRIAMGAAFDLSIYCFGGRDAADIVEVAHTHDAESRKVTRTIDLPLTKGTHVTISATVPDGFRLLDAAHTTFVWTGKLEHIRFPIFCEMHASMPRTPHTVVVTVVANDFAGVLHCTLVVGPNVSKHVQCQDEWYRLTPVSDRLEALPSSYKEIPFSELHMKRWIGAGFFGDAYLATYAGRDVVVKTLRQTADDVAALQHEAAVSALLGHHPCVVPFVGACTDPSAPLAIVTEYMPLGSLAGVVASPSASTMYPSSVRTSMLRDAANGLLHLHNNAFLHRDMAARNCLVDVNGRVKIADFGLARRGAVLDASMSVGPLKWMAPESLAPPHVFSSASDVFSFGVTMWEVYSGAKPFDGQHARDVAVRVCEGDRLPLADVHIPEAQLDLIARCFAADPTARPSMAEVYAHLA
ncbi:serine/threonine protein kinase [Saprolegnia parasitica CBS 223.65]|uniref:Serine/threonine protein kinase n=1 Tax=Saprolegnia parasitica (strain CBS 223.65) TaxID=695850 RepID=A0A067CUX8_SAPPC|nr:serine/threonine protein kinase [Saprolegnia parasitica CBS 223.65]KDO34514.1 serine/threonine protein kinase [Saprolegnia parasitica CBS 223.65]|eukprot:XP_012194192.1 serine/threonine protein kinase [Saprolegnia parasitica CBS 223.65]